MAIFYNQATLSYRGGVTNSNITAGELLDSVAVIKTATAQTYAPGDLITYIVNVSNNGAAVTGVTVTEDLGAYQQGGRTLYPLEYVSGSMRYYVDGEESPLPTLSENPLELSGIDVPAGSHIMLIYAARVTESAPLGPDAQIVNGTSVMCSCMVEPATASAAVTMESEAELTISKALTTPNPVGCGRITYTFVIQNTGAAEAAAEDSVVVTDTFEPRLTDLSVEYNGQPWTAPDNYSYDEATGLFVTGAGQITVPAAAYAPGEDGNWVTTPGVAVLTVTGTI
ncbi:MAG: DUF11 domain-containing protein [Clostridia bacterium]|nr:DUF11 domain-containing protein [Clostridia bacterium]